MKTVILIIAMMVGAAPSVTAQTRMRLTPLKANTYINQRLTRLTTKLDAGVSGRDSGYRNGSPLTNLGTGPCAPGYGASSTVTSHYNGFSVTTRNGTIVRSSLDTPTTRLTGFSVYSRTSSLYYRR